MIIDLPISDGIVTAFQARLLLANQQPASAKPTVSHSGAKVTRRNARLGVAATTRANFNVGAYDTLSQNNPKPAVVSITGKGAIGM